MTPRPAWLKKALDHPDVLGAGAKKRKKLTKEQGMRAVMSEFKKGTLRSGSGEHVKSRKQGIAIALSEARKKGAK